MRGMAMTCVQSLRTWRTARLICVIDRRGRAPLDDTFSEAYLGSLYSKGADIARTRSVL
jgi:hypothetical protein